MLALKKYLTSLIIVLALLFGAWYVSLQLTKQRIQLESFNKSNNQQQQSTPYVWDFESFGDIVGSFQYFWHRPIGKNYIYAIKGSNPQLSLNFSGESISTYEHSRLVIHSSEGLNGSLKLQTKSNLEDGSYYYLPKFNLSGTKQIIDLRNSWRGVNKQGVKTNQLKLNQITPHMTSLVLQFTNQHDKIYIDSISMPYNTYEKDGEAEYKINCLGEFDSKKTPDIQSHYMFVLSEPCWLPSQYMWLNDTIRKKYPSSFLRIDDLELITKPTLHKINKPYTQNVSINTIFYLYLGFFLVVIYLLLRFNYSHNASQKQELWYKLLAKQLLFRGIDKAIFPHHFMINYLVILVPTLIAILAMSFIALPDLSTFKNFPMYFVWAVFQQFILCYVLADRIFYTRTNNRLVASLLAASVFAIFICHQLC